MDPAERGSGLGRLLYEASFQVALARGCAIVRAITSPVAEVYGVPVASGYDGRGGDRVRFVRNLRDDDDAAL